MSGYLKGGPREQVLSKNMDRKKAISLAAILLCSYLFLFFNLGSYSLKEPDEGRYAEIPREMVVTGDYLVPHLNYVRYFEKPPLFYWMTALSYRIFGISEWSYRFPNALAAFFCVLATWFFTRRWFGEKTALLSSLVLVSSFGFFAMAHVVTIDMLFSFLLVCSLLCFYEYYRGRKTLFLYFSAMGLAFATLAKGPVAPVLLCFTVLLFLFSEKRLVFLRAMVTVKAILVFALVAVPWFLAMSIWEKGFFDFFFIDQHVLRFLTSKHNRTGPIYYFFPVLLGGLFPWSVFIPRAIVRYWRATELRLFFIWIAVVFGLFSLSESKLMPYILPIFPCFSIVLGYLFSKEWTKAAEWGAEIAVLTALFFCLALAGLGYGSINMDPYWRALLHELHPLERMRGLSLAIAGVSIVTFALMGFKKMRTRLPLLFLLGGFSLSLALVLMLHVHVIDGLRTTKQLAEIIKTQDVRSQILVNYRSFDESLPFYTGRRVYLAGPRDELAFGSQDDDAKGFFLTEDDFTRLFRSERNVLVVLKEKRLSHVIGLNPRKANVLRCQDRRCLVTNY
jgi:4-amino-4-deoxy-L-arabinose transferase-like glycosyltransferase